MNKYVITLDEWIVIYGCLPHMAKHIFNYPLEEELKKEKDRVLEQIDAILDLRTSFMEELFEELRDPAVAKHSLQQIEIIRYHVNELRGEL